MALSLASFILSAQATSDGVSVFSCRACRMAYAIVCRLQFSSCSLISTPKQNSIV